MNIRPLGLALLFGFTLFQNCGSSESNESAPATRQATPNAGTSSSPIPLTETYSSIHQNVFVPKCVSCHSSSNPQGNTDLTRYSSIVQNSHHMDLVTPGDPAKSHLYEMVQSGQMPPNGPQLSSAELQAISNWITNGAQNN